MPLLLFFTSHIYKNPSLPCHKVEVIVSELNVASACCVLLFLVNDRT